MQLLLPQPAESCSLHDDLLGLLPGEHQEAAAAGQRGQEGVAAAAGAGMLGLGRGECEVHDGGVCRLLPNDGDGS